VAGGTALALTPERSNVPRYPVERALRDVHLARSSNVPRYPVERALRDVHLARSSNVPRYPVERAQRDVHLAREHGGPCRARLSRLKQPAHA